MQIEKRAWKLIVYHLKPDFQHLMWSVTLGDKLCLCPKDSQKAKRVLDAGTGTGIWAMDYGEIHLILPHLALGL